VHQALKGGDRLKVNVLFIGFKQARVRRIASALRSAADLGIVPSGGSRRAGTAAWDPEDYDAVFISRDIDESCLAEALEDVRDKKPDMPLVLVHGGDPDGKAFLLANRYECLLYSELDSLGRTLTAGELAGTLKERLSEGGLGRKLMELSLSCGPCSTGR
jgi:hypothetical protein